MGKSKHLRVGNFDPGETTGFALMVNGDVVMQQTIDNASGGMIEWLLGGNCPGMDVMVIESFIVEPDFTGRAYASEVIGVLLLIAAQRGIKVRFQGRVMKRLVHDGDEAERFAWLREQGFTGVSHELDAITHGLVASRSLGLKDVVRRYWPQT